MREMIFCLIGLFLVVRAIPSRTDEDDGGSEKLTKIASEEGWTIDDPKNSRLLLKRETDRSESDIEANKIGCWRYCVQKRKLDGEDSIKRVNVIWNIVDEARASLSEKSSSNWGVFSDRDKDLRWESSTISSEKSKVFSTDDPKCELNIELGCESFLNSNLSTWTIIDEFLNSYQKKLVSRSDAIGFNSIVFGINEGTEKLRILAFGKLSQAVLEIPMTRRESDFTDARRTRPTFSLSRTSGAEGLLIDARNPPPGRWRLNLLGVENSNYSFSVAAISSKRMVENFSVINHPTTGKPTNQVNLENEKDELNVNLSELLSRPQRLAYPRTSNDDNSARAIKSDDEQLINEETAKDYSKTSESLVPGEPSARALTLETNETKLSRKVNLEVELMEAGSEGKIDDEDTDVNARILGDSELADFSRITEDIESKRKRTVVDLNPSAALVARPGTFHDVVFTVTNNQALGIRHTFQGSSRPFTYIGVIPNAFWIRAGETINVAVRIQVPNVEYTEPNTVTLYVRANDNFEVTEKSTYVYVQGFDGKITTDNNEPSIDYSFNDNCAGKLHRDRCAKSRWSVEITVKDPDSGLKRVTSLPSGVEPLTEFIGGTRSRVIFYYSSTCCYTTVDVTATDLQGNSYTRTIDVTDWDNLSQGEIAAIVVGALFILLLIILIILLIIYCIRKRKSHDLSYSQRYGSRPPASAERTNF